MEGRETFEFGELVLECRKVEVPQHAPPDEKFAPEAEGFQCAFEGGHRGDEVTLDSIADFGGTSTRFDAGLQAYGDGELVQVQV